MARLVLALVLALAACAGPNPAEHFCNDYGDAMRGLYAAADNYANAPAEFADIARTTKDELSRIRVGAPNQELRQAFDSAYFSLTVFANDDGLADFLTRTGFAHDDVVEACADNGITLTADGG